MRKRSLKYPCIYRHFKGNIYVTLNVSEPVNKDELKDYYKKIAVLHTESNTIMIIYVTEDGYLIHSNEYPDELVIYRNLYENSSELYARPMNVFMGEIDKEKYPQYISRYRFEEYKKEVKYYE